MKGIRKIFAVLLALVCCIPGRSGIRGDVEYLSSPMLEGRGSCSRGGSEAAFFIIRRMRALGLEPTVQSFALSGGLGHNIAAVLRGNPGSDKYILICAKYDGLGIINGQIYPGADANASGAAVMLWLAEKLAGNGGNYVFLALDGHTDGFAGAEAAQKLPYKYSLVVNLDTIGSTLAPPNKYRPDFLIALGGKPFEKGMEAANIETRLRLYYDYYRSKAFTEYFYAKASDHVPFLRKGIDCVMFTSGITMNTNKVSDTAETLDFDILERRAELILRWLGSLL